MKRSPGVYLLKNTVNEKVYIGSSVNVASRIQNHIKSLRENTHINPELQNFWNKYGEKSFIFICILVCERKDIIYYEQLVIDFYTNKLGWANLFNVLRVAGSRLGAKLTEQHKANLKKACIGNRSRTGQIQSAEERLKKSVALKGNQNFLGKKHSVETKAKISNSLKGNKYAAGVIPSIETIQKRRASLRGRIVSEETRKKISMSLMGHKVSEETRKKISESLKPTKGRFMEFLKEVG
jgi:group I intron endonuclease